MFKGVVIKNTVNFFYLTAQTDRLSHLYPLLVVFDRIKDLQDLKLCRFSINLEI